MSCEGDYKKNGEKTKGYRRQLKEKARMRQGKREGDRDREKKKGNWKRRGYLKRGRSCAAA